MSTSDATPAQSVARLSELTEGRIVRVKARDRDLVLIRTGNLVQAFAADCPHAGAPLDGGAVCQGRLICPWHKAAFSVADGSVLEPPALDDLVRYPTRVEDDEVLVAMEPIGSSPPARGMKDRTIAVIGSGAAGTAGIAELRRRGFDGRILLIGPEADAPYDRTALSKFLLSGEMQPDDVPPLRSPEDWQRYGVERMATTVTRLDAAARRIALADGGTVTYDAALLATGALAKRPDLPGMTLRGVKVLRSVDDARDILASAATDARIVILGSSFIGLEAASALRKRGHPITVVAPDRVPFARQFGVEIGGMFRRLHERNGVEFRLESEVESIAGRHAVEGVVLKGGEELPADLVLIGVGVAPATDFVHGTDRAKDGGIVVDAACHAADGLYAAGDIAAFPFQGEAVRIEHWRVAQQHGRIAAAAMLGEHASQDGVPFFWTYHYGQRFEYLGHAATWDDIRIEGDPERQDFVALQVKNGLVAGVIACQRERTTAMLIDLMRAHLPVGDALDVIKKEQSS